MRRIGWGATLLAVLLTPGLSRAEVSVVLDPQDGSVRKVLFLRGGGRDAGTIWKQVRAGVPLELMLNPLGDTLGDLAPTIRTDPVSGAPWVVWPANAGNLKQIVVSRWEGNGWSARQPIVANPDPVPRDELHPGLAFDAAGVPIVVWERDERVGRILFSIWVGGLWTPPLQLSDDGVDSRRPMIAVEDGTAFISFVTPSGRVTRALATVQMIDSATDLMDTPIPPGNAAGSDDDAGGDFNDSMFQRE
ncbi:MAG: hypothetical protein ACE5JH_10530 [Acidobacteriota bacterium]